MRKGKLPTAGLSIYRACLLGICVSIGILLLLAMVATLMISKEKIDISASCYLAGVAQFIATFAGCLIAGKVTKEGTAVACSIVAGACVFVQMAAAILFFGGISGNFVPGLIASLAGFGGAILLCISKNNRSISKKRKVHSR